MIRAVEGDAMGGGRGVQGTAAPVVVCLIGGDTGLKEEVGAAEVVADDKNDVALQRGLTRGEFGQVDAAWPVSRIVRVGHMQKEWIGPVAFEKSRSGIGSCRGLRSAGAS